MERGDVVSLRFVLAIVSCLAVNLPASSQSNPALVSYSKNIRGLDVQVASCENRRGEGWQPLYKNQDRVLVEELPTGEVLVGVFDGHGEQEDATTASVECVTTMLPQLLSSCAITPDNLKKVNADLQAHLKKQDFAQNAGTTATFAVIGSAQTLISNTGDSRAIFPDAQGAMAETQDHKPSVKTEYERIRQHGGRMLYGGRYVTTQTGADHSLAITRTLGNTLINDEKVITSEPDIYESSFRQEGYMLLGTDGLFDVLSSSAVIDFIKKTIAKGRGEGIATNLAFQAQMHLSRDDITVVFISSTKP